MKFFCWAMLCAAFAFHPRQHDKETFNRLAALQGTWMMKTPRSIIFESWQQANDTLMQVTSYRLKGIDMQLQERIAVTINNGGIYYTSLVEGQNNGQAISFRLTRATENEFVFENPQHDFPKRIVYKIAAADSLHAFIDDGASSKKRSDFYYKRIK